MISTSSVDAVRCFDRSMRPYHTPPWRSEPTQTTWEYRINGKWISPDDDIAVCHIHYHMDSLKCNAQYVPAANMYTPSSIICYLKDDIIYIPWPFQLALAPSKVVSTMYIHRNSRRIPRTDVCALLNVAAIREKLLDVRVRRVKQTLDLLAHPRSFPRVVWPQEYLKGVQDAIEIEPSSQLYALERFYYEQTLRGVAQCRVCGAECAARDIVIHQITCYTKS